MRVCLIGDSHLAALKLGWPRIQAGFPAVTPVFFAVPASLLQLEISDGKLVAPNARVRKRLANTSGGDGDIGPDYDVYVLCGLELSSMRGLRAYFANRPAAGALCGATADDFAAVMEPALRECLACDIAAKLRKLTAAPLFFIANPLPAHERHAARWQRLRNARLEATVAEAYERACSGIAGCHAASFIPQPAETLDPSGLTTRSRFYLLAPDEVAKETSLHTHMNPDFGAIVLRDALQKIEAHLAQL